MTGLLLKAAGAVLTGMLALLLLVAGTLAGSPGAGSAEVSGPTSPGSVGTAASDLHQVRAVPAHLREAFLAAARRHALPPALLAAVAATASGFDPTAVGPLRSGERTAGLMQLTPSAFGRFNSEPGASLLQPGPSVMAAAAHLLAAGRLVTGGWDGSRALHGYRGALPDVDLVLARAAQYGYRYSPLAPPLSPDRYVFPVVGRVSYGAEHHDYPATDIFGPIGLPIVACVRSEVLRLSRTDRGKGGLSVTLRGEDGWRYYYAHLDTVRADLAPGYVVEAGELLGTNGKTGNARTTPPHLHLGISRTGSVAGELNPYPYLQAWPRIAA